MRFLKWFLIFLVAVAAGFFIFSQFFQKDNTQKPLWLGGQKITQKKIVLGNRANAKAEKLVQKTSGPPKFSNPKVAIILDDWGNNYSLTDLAVRLGQPITLAILPKLKHSKEIAQTAFENHLGVMLHMPMQPKNTSEHLEPHTITTTMSDAMIVEYLDEAIASVPHIEGVNNHMGSAATSDARVMRVFLNYLKSKNLFFVDSNTIKTTQGPTVAKEVGINFAVRDVFIDNELSLEKIKLQLAQAKKIALTRGQVVVIGHDHKVTLEAIKELIPDFQAAGIEFVLVKDLVKRP